jgi:hypothetical protein
MLDHAQYVNYRASNKNKDWLHNCTCLYYLLFLFALLYLFALLASHTLHSKLFVGETSALDLWALSLITNTNECIWESRAMLHVLTSLRPL